MKWTHFATMLLLCGTLTWLVGDAMAGIEDKPASVYIRPDGTIWTPDPCHNVLMHDGEYYYLVGDNNDVLLVERDNILLDGRGFSLASPPRVYGRVGLTLMGRWNVTVCNLRLASVWVGVDLIDSQHVTLRNVTVEDCRVAVRVANGTRLNVTESCFMNNDEDGIQLGDSAQNVIVANMFTANRHALFLEDASANIIMHNRICDNQDGIVLIESSNNTIETNNLVENADGVWLFQSFANTFYRNNFIDNAEHVVSIESQNLWNQNYWSGYDGNPSYVIDELNRDDNPSVTVIPEFHTPLILVALVLLSVLLVVWKRSDMKDMPCKHA